MKAPPTDEEMKVLLRLQWHSRDPMKYRIVGRCEDCLLYRNEIEYLAAWADQGSVVMERLGECPKCKGRTHSGSGCTDWNPRDEAVYAFLRAE
jgi:hypothetical protein